MEVLDVYKRQEGKCWRESISCGQTSAARWSWREKTDDLLEIEKSGKFSGKSGWFLYFT